jgi:DNA ligase 1
MKYFYPNQPIPLAPTSKFFDMLVKDQNWIAEEKRNGWRCLIQKTEGKLKLWSRHKTIFQQDLRKLRMELNACLPDETCIDGELIHNRTKHIKEKLVVWDVLIFKGREVMDKSLRERRNLLEEIFPENTNHIEVAEWFITDKKIVYLRAVEEEGKEGVVLKRLDSKYLWSERKCRETPYWIKVKKIEDHVKVR